MGLPHILSIVTLVRSCRCSVVATAMRVLLVLLRTEETLWTLPKKHPLSARRLQRLLLTTKLPLTLTSVMATRPVLPLSPSVSARRLLRRKEPPATKMLMTTIRETTGK